MSLAERLIQRIIYSDVLIQNLITNLHAMFVNITKIIVKKNFDA